VTSRLAELASLDANPSVVGRRGRGAFAVDLLAVLSDSVAAR
jgi:hypothetical protein